MSLPAYRVIPSGARNPLRRGIPRCARDDTLPHVPGRLAPPALRDRHLPAAAERFLRDADRRRGLAALELVRVDELQDAGHERPIEAGRGDLVDLFPLLDVELQDGVE